MTILKRIFLIIILIFLTFCSSKTDIIKERRVVSEMLKNFISVSELEKAGMEHFDPLFMEILVDGEDLYILNKQDSLLIKFNKTKPIRSYKEKSQGPGGMLFAESIFIYDKNSLGLFDMNKNSVIWFDKDLNYKSEKKILTQIRKLTFAGDRFIAFEIFPDNKLFCTFDNQFNVTGKYVDAVLTAPLKLISPVKYNNMGYLLNDGTVASTTWQYLEKNCSINIFDIKKNNNKLSLKWEQEHKPIQSDIDNFKNSYSSLYLGKHGQYYVVFNTFSKAMRQLGYNELLIFRENGDLFSRDKMDIGIINSVSNDSNVFFFDDEKGILVLDLKEL